MSSGEGHTTLPSEARRRPLRAGCCVAVVSLVACCLVVGRPLVRFAAGLPADTAPAARHLQEVDEAELLASARDLMADPTKSGFYWNYDYVTPPGAPSLEKDDRLTYRSARMLPAPLRRMKPAEVAVSPTDVTLVWSGAGYGYGYKLILLRDESAGEQIRETNGLYNHSEELSPGVWSQYMFH